MALCLEHKQLPDIDMSNMHSIAIVHQQWLYIHAHQNTE